MNEHIAPVSDRISDAIKEFHRVRTKGHAFAFHADDLRVYVGARVGITAPGSSDRILRNLRQNGALDYRVINRRASLYEFVNKAVAA